MRHPSSMARELFLSPATPIPCRAYTPARNLRELIQRSFLGARHTQIVLERGDISHCAEGVARDLRSYTKSVIHGGMRLQEYIKQVGPKTFAEKFGVTERAAISWQYGARRPRAEVAQKIVSGSPVTWEGIYGAQQKAAASRRNRSHHQQPT